MSGITVPTLDQIKGSTVMTKLRCLVQKFIDFAQEVNDKIDEPLEQAQQAVTTANTASATANSASENANNASTAANQAATTVAGYNTRLTEAEDNIAGNTSNITTLDGEMETVQQTLVNINEHFDYVDADLTNTVKKVTSGSQNVVNGLTVGKVPDDGTGVVDRDYIDSYEHMLRTSGSQTAYGPKLFESLSGLDRISIISYAIDSSEQYTTQKALGELMFFDSKGLQTGSIFNVLNPDGTIHIAVSVKNRDGTRKSVRLITSD